MKTKAQITFGLVDITAKSDSQLSVNNKQVFVDLNDLKEEELEEAKYGTCERNQFVLDGTFKLMPEEVENMGWWSNQMSDASGNFETPLTLEINFSEVHSSLGITLIFSEAGDFCNRLNIKYYGADNNILSSKEFTPDSYNYIYNNIVEKYKKIVITFYSTNRPFRYLKLYKILYGAEKIFEGENLMSANLLEEVDLLSSEISINTLDFTVFSDNDDFNIINPKGVFKLLQKKQKLKVIETFTKENKKLDMGTFYLSYWENKEHKTMLFKAQDILGVLDTTTFYGAIYKDALFKNVIKEIILSAGLDESFYEIAETLQNIKMTGYIPICSHRQAIQQAVFAVCAVADCSRSDKIKIYQVENSNTNKQINEKNSIFQNTRVIKQTEKITTVALTAHRYDQDSTVNEEELVKYSFPLTLSGIHTMKWEEPAFEIGMGMENSKTRIEEQSSMVKARTCNSITFDFTEYRQYLAKDEMLAVSVATEAYYRQYGNYPKTLYFQYEEYFNNKAMVSLRDPNTVAKDWYTIDLINNTVSNEMGYSESITSDYLTTVDIIVYGKKYKHTTTEYKISSDKDIEATEENTKIVENAYLINSSNVDKVAKYILGYYTNTFEDSFEMILTEEKLAESREIDTDYNRLIGNITQLDIDLTGGFLAQTKMINKLKEENDNGTIDI